MAWTSCETELDCWAFAISPAVKQLCRCEILTLKQLDARFPLASEKLQVMSNMQGRWGKALNG